MGAVYFRVVVGSFFLGVFCWAVGWVPWVFRGVLRFFCVLGGALRFFIYTTLLIKKKDKTQGLSAKLGLSPWLCGPKAREVIFPRHKC